MAFQCLQCGRCCTGTLGYVWVNQEEINKIASRLKLSANTFGSKYLRQVGNRISLIEESNGDCIFYHQDQGCIIYEDRPHQCRAFPLDPEKKYRFPQWMINQCSGMIKLKAEEE